MVLSSRIPSLVNLVTALDSCSSVLLRISNLCNCLGSDFPVGPLDKICKECFSGCDVKKLQKTLYSEYSKTTKIPLKTQVSVLQNVKRVKELECYAWFKHPLIVKYALEDGKADISSVILAYRDLYTELVSQKGCNTYCFRVAWEKNTWPMNEICQKAQVAELFSQTPLYSLAKSVVDAFRGFVAGKVSEEELREKFEELKKQMDKGVTDELRELVTKLGEIGLSALIMYYVATHPAEVASLVLVLTQALGRPVKVLAVKLAEGAKSLAGGLRSLVSRLSAEGLSSLEGLEISWSTVAGPLLVITAVTLTVLAVVSALNLLGEEPKYALMYTSALPLMLARGDLYTPTLREDLEAFTDSYRRGILNLLEKAEELKDSDEQKAYELMYYATYYLSFYYSLQKALDKLNVKESDEVMVGVKQLEAVSDILLQSLEIYEATLSPREVPEEATSDVAGDFLSSVSNFLSSFASFLSEPVVLLSVVGILLVAVPLVLRFLASGKEISKQ